MKANMGILDRLIRFAIAVGIGILFFTNVISGTLGVIGIVIASIFAATALIGVCPLYALIGIKTCKAKEC